MIRIGTTLGGTVLVEFKLKELRYIGDVLRFLGSLDKADGKCKPPSEKAWRKFEKAAKKAFK